MKHLKFIKNNSFLKVKMNTVLGMKICYWIIQAAKCYSTIKLTENMKK